MAKRKNKNLNRMELEQYTIPNLEMKDTQFSGEDIEMFRDIFRRDFKGNFCDTVGLCPFNMDAVDSIIESIKANKYDMGVYKEIKREDILDVLYFFITPLKSEGKKTGFDYANIELVQKIWLSICLNFYDLVYWDRYYTGELSERYLSGNSVIAKLSELAGSTGENDLEMTHKDLAKPILTIRQNAYKVVTDKNFEYENNGNENISSDVALSTVLKYGAVCNMRELLIVFNVLNIGYSKPTCGKEIKKPKYLKEIMILFLKLAGLHTLDLTYISDMIFTKSSISYSSEGVVSYDITRKIIVDTLCEESADYYDTLIRRVYNYTELDEGNNSNIDNIESIKNLYIYKYEIDKTKFRYTKYYNKYGELFLKVKERLVNEYGKKNEYIKYYEKLYNSYSEFVGSGRTEILWLTWLKNKSILNGYEDRLFDSIIEMSNMELILINEGFSKEEKVYLQCKISQVLESLYSTYYFMVLIRMSEIVKGTNYLRSEYGVLSNLIKNHKMEYTKYTEKIDELQRDLRVAVEKNKSVYTDEYVSKLKKDIEVSKQEYGELDNTLRKIENKNLVLERKLYETEELLKSCDDESLELKETKAELEKLQRDVQSLEEMYNSESRMADIDEMYEAIQNEQILFVGGKPTMVSRFKKMFPNSVFMNKEEEASPKSIKSSSCVVIFSKLTTHAHQQMAERYVGRDKIIFMSIVNKESVIEQVYTKLVGENV